MKNEQKFVGMILKTCYFYFLRHGELTGKGQLAGHTDIPLSVVGLQQMRTSTYGLDINRCISSPLKRCKVFSKEFSINQNLPLDFSSAIQEMNFGEWDGEAFDQLWQMPKPNIGDFWETPDTVTPPRGETFADFSIRVKAWWEHQVAQHTEENVLVVTHAGVIKQIIGLVTGVSPLSSIHSRLEVKYGGVICVKVYSDDNHPPWVSLVF
ncbi:histidine phosphatase family protein [Psychrosphaera sp. B3R10]|nr:histidine phosphatase family protein [Psychrosphaera sp. B3R10]